MREKPSHYLLLLALAACADLPDRLESAAAHNKIPIEEVDRGIAMTRDELYGIPYPKTRIEAFLPRENTVLIASRPVGDP
jgi:hypothetical protein